MPLGVTDGVMVGKILCSTVVVGMILCVLSVDGGSTWNLVKTCMLLTK